MNYGLIEGKYQQSENGGKKPLLFGGLCLDKS